VLEARKETIDIEVDQSAQPDWARRAHKKRNGKLSTKIA